MDIFLGVLQSSFSYEPWVSGEGVWVVRPYFIQETSALSFCLTNIQLDANAWGVDASMMYSVQFLWSSWKVVFVMLGCMSG